MTKYGYRPKDRDRRIVKKFALFPITIYYRCDRWLQRQYYETKWLETVYIEQEYKLQRDWWDNVSFVTKEEFIDYKKENKQ